jgi:hypothetical protein
MPEQSVHQMLRFGQNYKAGMQRWVRMMPWFYFDLIIDEHPHDQGGMILENVDGARNRADDLADELRLAKPELDRKRSYVRVMNEGDEEVYRTPLEAVPKRSVHTLQK